MRKNKKSILLTFDVEDWFQVENFKSVIKFSTWNSFKLRVEKNINLLLDLLDSFPFSVRATFFILGWIAEKRPDLVRQIYARGHEVASHGFNHHLCTILDSKALLQDLSDSRKLLEDITGHPVMGYRAPSFAVNDDALGWIHKAGYQYDSSYNSFSGHGRYGIIDLSRARNCLGIYQYPDGLFEIPVSNLALGKKVFPLGGGGYFRLLPCLFFKAGVRHIQKNGNFFVFYAHPWEFDPDQPRVREASRWFKFRHYINLHKTEAKLSAMINAFPDCHFVTCAQHLKTIKAP